MNKIIKNSSIWDLHLHSCMSPKSTGNLIGMSVDEYVDYLNKTFNKYPDLEMISFTDHNKINFEVYEEFYSKNEKVVLIPGIELDLLLNKNDDETKHILIYFNVSRNELKQFSDKLNKFIINNEKLLLDDVLDFLVGNKIEFVLNPHAFKQGKRGIESDWTTEDITNSEAHKYMDQFFCFWETSGKSAIARAKQFINDFNIENRISIVSFSDSCSKEKLEEYLKHPNQYFNSLPNFKGIELVGTDCRRIVNNPYNISKKSNGDFISKIVINNKKIEFSPKLNTIIGGRGSGKSLLLDSVALHLSSKVSQNSNYLSDERIKYIKKINIDIYNGHGDKMNIDEMAFDYFNQSYVNKIFENSDSTKALAMYFETEFKSISDINDSEILQNLKNEFNLEIKNIDAKEKSNISGLCEKFIKTDNLGFNFKFYKSNLTSLKKISYLSKKSFRKKIDDSKLIPKELTSDDEIKSELNILFELLNKKIHLKNEDKIIASAKNYFINSYLEYVKSKSNTEKEKQNIESNFVTSIELIENEYIQRVSIINSYIKIAKLFNPEYVNNNVITISDGNKFKFEKNLIIQNPINYLEEILRKYLDKRNIYDCSLKNLIDIFCFHLDDYIKESKEKDMLIEELLSLNLKIKKNNKIYYSTDGEEYEDLYGMSPGTQTNILMEYIVSKDTSIPLLIDQPEDNIDNETIYGKLTKWFSSLKNQRQILVVTHDANIVINSDAENLIVSNKIDKDLFDYRYGALEYKDNILSASKILDGGTEAVERRLKKYGR